LYDFMKANQYRRYKEAHVRTFTLQLVRAIAVIHDLDLIHTDLKPENVLLEDSEDCEVVLMPRVDRPDETEEVRVPRCTRIKLIDFGGATYDNDRSRPGYSPRTVPKPAHARAFAQIVVTFGSSI